MHRFKTESKMQTTAKQNKIKNPIIQWLLIAAGTFFLGLGLVGIFIPVLPTTPFLLLAAACFARSSKRFYKWLLKNKWFGSYIKNYREGRGIPMNVKLVTISVLWITILISVFLVIQDLWLELLLLLIASAVTIHILTIKTFKKS